MPDDLEDLSFDPAAIPDPILDIGTDLLAKVDEKRETRMDSDTKAFNDAVAGMKQKMSAADMVERKKLRDHFAGLAMQAFLSRDAEETYETLSGWAYEAADAMLAAREAK